MKKSLRIKISKATKKAMINPLIREKMRLAKLGKKGNHAGYKCTKEQIERMQKAHIGQKAWNKGIVGIIKQSKEHIEKRASQLEGKNNPAWKGGITPKNITIRSSIEFRLWREAVFARDNWTCQKTGIRGGKLHSHHIKNFAQYPELRFAIDNGITFSKESHKEFHKKYGFKNNTKQQIKEFIKEPLAVIKG